MGQLQCHQCNCQCEGARSTLDSAPTTGTAINHQSLELDSLNVLGGIEDSSENAQEAESSDETEPDGVGIGGSLKSMQRMDRQTSSCGLRRLSYIENHVTNPNLVALFPTYVTSWNQISKWKSFIAHEEALREGMIWVYRPVHGMVVFWSHQWLGRPHPDPENVQLKCMQGLLKKIASGASIGSLFADSKHTVSASDVSQQLGISEYELTSSLDESVHWMDYFSVPQDVTSTKQREAILSIAAFAASAHLMIVLCPPKGHWDSQKHCDLTSWRRRGWCRLELLSMAWTHEGFPVVICSSPDQLRFATELSLKKMDAQSAPGRGALTCCEMNHTRNGKSWPCDKNHFSEIITKLHSVRVEAVRIRNGFSLQWRWAVAMGPIVFSGLTKMAQGQAGLSNQTQFLEEYHLGLDELDEVGNTVLHWASFVGNVKCVQQLVSNAGRTCIIHCRNREEMHADIHQYSLLAGGGVTPLMLAAERGFGDVLQVLLDAKSNVNLAATYGATSLNLAATRGHSTCVDILLMHSADINTQLNEQAGFFGHCMGFTPLHAAAIGGQLDIVKQLMNYRADPDARSRFGATPLHCAVAVKDNAQVVQYLLEARANPDCTYTASYPVPTWRQATPESIARDQGFNFSLDKLSENNLRLRSSMRMIPASIARGKGLGSGLFS